MQIPRRVDYGLRAVIYLAIQDREKCCSITKIAKQQGVPKKFLKQIIQDLLRCGLIKSKRGACGGYAQFQRMVPAREMRNSIQRTCMSGVLLALRTLHSVRLLCLLLLVED